MRLLARALLLAATLAGPLAPLPAAAQDPAPRRAGRRAHGPLPSVAPHA